MGRGGAVVSVAPIPITSTRSIGPGLPPLVVAEMSGSHNGDLGRALSIIDMVADAGAEAVKLQTYTADTITIDHDGPGFRIADDHPLWPGARLYELYRRAATPWDWHGPLFERARERGLIAFSSPFDPTAVEFLEDLGAPIYKIASLEIGDVALLRAVARTGKPVILSDGAASMADIELAVSTIRAEGNDRIVVLACTSSYPADPAESNLRSIPTLADAFGVQAGVSDHTLDLAPALVAVALGATVIEKHVTLDRDDGGVDSAFALDASGLRALVDQVGIASVSLGSAQPRVTAGEAASTLLRRSLYVVEDVPHGALLTPANVRSIRPAGGLAPRHLDEVLGRRSARNLARGTPLSWHDVD